MLTWAQLFFKIRIINIIDDFVSINICSFDRKTMLGRYNSPQNENSDHLGILWRNWGTGYITMYQQKNSFCEEQDWVL